MIDYNRLSDAEYFNRTVSEIRSLNDERVLMDVLKSLSAKLYDRKIDPAHANILLDNVKSRLSVITGGNRIIGNRVVEDNQKVLKLSPTSVHSRAGTVSMVLLIANIAITSIMYTLLVISKFIK